jgi:2-hydroxychromene-2-carboxylate isomerase
MGQLIYLDQRRAERPSIATPSIPTFVFDLGCPVSYLLAERIERTLGEADWVPVDGSGLRGELTRAGERDWRKRAETLARSQRLPLVWPERFPAGAPCALRAAAYACELGAGPSFALAAFRLAFCGGFDLEDPEALAEAAAAAGVPLDECLAAAGETSRDEELQETCETLRGRGVDALPAVRVQGRWFGGESAILAASALLSAGRAGTHSLTSPLAPVG